VFIVREYYAIPHAVRWHSVRSHSKIATISFPHIRHLLHTTCYWTVSRNELEITRKIQHEEAECYCLLECDAVLSVVEMYRRFTVSSAFFLKDAGSASENVGTFLPDCRGASRSTTVRRTWNLIEKIGGSCNAFDPYPGSVQFESWLWHCLSWKGFPKPLQVYDRIIH